MRSRRLSSLVGSLNTLVRECHQCTTETSSITWALLCWAYSRCFASLSPPGGPESVNMKLLPGVWGKPHFLPNQEDTRHSANKLACPLITFHKLSVGSSSKADLHALPWLLHLKGYTPSQLSWPFLPQHPKSSHWSSSHVSYPMTSLASQWDLIFAITYRPLIPSDWEWESQSISSCLWV